MCLGLFMANKTNLLIVGAGIYSVVDYETAMDMGCFEKIDFVDDEKEITPNGIRVLGRICDLGDLSKEYDAAFVAIGNGEKRKMLLDQIERETSLNVVSLISPKAYVAPSAEISLGCIIEPMAVVHSKCVLQRGCIISAGAVLNHASQCGECAHVDCHATVAGFAYVPEKKKVCSGENFGV